MRSALLFGAALALILLIPTQVTSAQDALPWETLEELCGTNYSSYEPALELYGPMQFLEIPDVVIAYYRLGNASSELPPVVLVVGFSNTMKDWPLTILSDLAEDREVIIFDNRGQGSSRDTSPDVPLSILSMANDTKNFVEALDLARPPHLLGWSMGGMITLKAAAMFADSFDRFAVFSGGPGSLRSQLPSLEILEKFLLEDTMTEVYRLGTLFPLNTTSGVEAACKYAEEMQYTPADTIRKLATRRQLEALIEYVCADFGAATGRVAWSS
ncbi:hypothetical protein ACKKBG_A00620 [Auxenochlorella protothecoides x Auxenochlorella symbiontica]